MPPNADKDIRVEVDVIVPVHNASSTLRETIASAMSQVWLLEQPDQSATAPRVSVHVCCYNDASTDDSWSILQSLDQEYASQTTTEQDSKTEESTRDTTVPGKRSGRRESPIPSQLYIATSAPGSLARGAGYARNQAVNMRSDENAVALAPASVTHRFLCWLDSDDVMYPTRVHHQVSTFLAMNETTRYHTILGTTFDRIPRDATPHYTAWANQLSPSRLGLERFREITVLQPTWMMCRARFVDLGGYLEAPPVNEDSFSVADWVQQTNGTTSDRWRLVHATLDTPLTLRVAEDLRLFHEHLASSGRLERVSVTLQDKALIPHDAPSPEPSPLVTYRHSATSQSGQTPRKLLLALRVAALEHTIWNGARSTVWDHCVVWGAGRDGKDFVKALSPQARRRVYGMVDVDDQKIARGFYDVPQFGSKPKDKAAALVRHRIPIVHFSLLVRNAVVRDRLYSQWKQGGTSDTTDHGPAFGHVDKSFDPDRNNFAPNHPPNGSIPDPAPPLKRAKIAGSNATEKPDPGVAAMDVHRLASLPVVVCVAMYRTNGALERNVELIGRTEGVDLWHFS